MIEEQTASVDINFIRDMLKKNKGKMKLSLSVCAHCSLCAESCFLFNAHHQDPKYMPSYKFIHSIGTLYKKKGKVDRSMLEEMSINIWERCVLCTRCYCPFGIDIPSMIALARSICRSQGVFPRYD